MGKPAPLGARLRLVLVAFALVAASAWLCGAALAGDPGMQFRPRLDKVEEVPLPTASSGSSGAGGAQRGQRQGGEALATGLVLEGWPGNCLRGAGPADP